MATSQCAHIDAGADMLDINTNILPGSECGNPGTIGVSDIELDERGLGVEIQSRLAKSTIGELERFSWATKIFREQKAKESSADDALPTMHFMLKLTCPLDFGGCE